MVNSWTELYEVVKGANDIYETFKGDDGPSQQQVQASPRNIKRGRGFNQRVVSGVVGPAKVTKVNLGYGDPEAIHTTFVGHTLRNYRLS